MQPPELDPMLEPIMMMAAELDAAASKIGLFASITLHGTAWPEGMEPTGELLVSCYGGERHGAHRSAALGVATVFVARPATEAEVAAKRRHDPRCTLFRAEDWASASRRGA